MRPKNAFSGRTNWRLEENDLVHAMRAAQAAGREVLDLTVSNPTLCDFDYGPILRTALRDEAISRYEPQPRGLASARGAVAEYYAGHGAIVSTECVCLTTSTSEAYSFLFRLLCDAGDEVLVARPSYPLFDYLAQLEDVVLREYPLRYDPNADGAHGWSIDLEALEAAVTDRCRAILLVHPNNPTGNFVSSRERLVLESICVRHGLALIVDEVFLDYVLTMEGADSFAKSKPECLCFVLSGISKVCALPQMKVSWLAALGPQGKVAEAMERIEVIADTFLSMNTPQQLALPDWLAARNPIQLQIRQRIRTNLEVLDDRVRGTQASRLEMHAGWTAILRVPRTVGDIAFAMAALERGALVQPGEFYGLPEGRIVLSLLTPPRRWSEGLARLPIDD